MAQKNGIGRKVAILGIVLIGITGCGRPKELEGAWHEVVEARDRYELCTLSYKRNVAACRSAKRAYDAERRAYGRRLEDYRLRERP